MRHQTFQTELLHSRQMQSVDRAAVKVAGHAVLSERRPKKRGREGAKFIRCLAAEKGKSSFQLTPCRTRQIARQIVGLELYHHF